MALSTPEFVNRWVYHFAPEGLEVEFPTLIKSPADARSFRGKLGFFYKLHVIKWKKNPDDFAYAFRSVTKKGLPFESRFITQELRNFENRRLAREREAAL